MSSGETESGKVKRGRPGKRRRHGSRHRSLSRLRFQLQPYLRWIFYGAVVLIGLVFGYRLLGPLLSRM
jgi:hypothetical protein